MNITASIIPNFLEILRIFALFVIHGGWVIFAIVGIYMAWFLYIHEIQHQFLDSIEWCYLEIKVPKQNTVSTLAVEAIFAQMHALHRSLTPVELYVEGHFQMWYSLELVSFGGKISFIVRTPKAYRHLVESAFYSKYPLAEIQEISDYMENFEYNVESEEYEIFGTEFKLTEDSSIPIKTYVDFEHSSAEEKIIDPLSGLFQTMSRMEPYEFFGVQLLIRPKQENEWLPQAERKIKQLTGEELPHKVTFFGFLLKPIDWFSKFSYKETLLGGSHGHAQPENKPKNNWLNMTEGEKQRVALIEKKMSKPGYDTKLRILYITPKEKYDKIKRLEIIGSFRHLSSGYFNTMKSDGKIWTKVDPLFSGALEKFYLDWETKRRKKLLVKGYKARSMHVGAAKFTLNIEEIATLYHFPITAKDEFVISSILSTESKRVEPPANLPTVSDN